MLQIIKNGNRVSSRRLAPVAWLLVMVGLMLAVAFSVGYAGTIEGGAIEGIDIEPGGTLAMGPVAKGILAEASFVQEFSPTHFIYLPGIRVAVDSADFQVGMVSDVGGMDDNSFNENTWAGLQRAQTELGVEAQFIESVAQADYEKNITEFADQGYDLIFTVGFLLGDATEEVAGQYTNTKFAIIDFTYDPPIPNIQGSTFDVDEVAFPAGYLAAGWAELKDPGDPQVGWVGGMQIPPVEQFIVAYEAGVDYYNQQKGANVEVKGVYVGDFEAPDEGKIRGSALIDEGVEVIFGVGGTTGTGALEAALERGKWGIGVDVDQYYLTPYLAEILLTSCLKRMDNAAFTVVQQALAGNFQGGGVYTGRLENEGVSLAPYHDFETEIPTQLKQEVQAVIDGIIAGVIDTGW